MKCVERLKVSLGLSAGQVQIDRGLFEIAMTEQNLDRAQIGTGFEQVRCKAEPQGMRMDVLVLEPGANSGLPVGEPEGSVAKFYWLREDGLNSSGAGHVRVQVASF